MVPDIYFIFHWMTILGKVTYSAVSTCSLASQFEIAFSGFLSCPGAELGTTLITLI